MANESFSAYVALPNSAKQPLPGAQESGTLNPNESMQISIYVRPKSANPLPETPATPMTREDYAGAYGADPADIAQIVAFAQAHGLTVVQTDLTRRVVVLGGTVATMTAAFQVDSASLYPRRPGLSWPNRHGAGAAIYRSAHRECAGVG